MRSLSLLSLLLVFGLTSMPLVVASAGQSREVEHRFIHKRIAARSSNSTSSKACKVRSTTVSTVASTSTSKSVSTGKAATKSASATSSAPSSSASSSSKYKLVDLHEGSSFFDGWNFYTGSDPTHGNVEYVSQSSASSQGLAVVQSDNTSYIGVDYKSTVAKGGNRNSVRISTKKTYSSGLFIADFSHMPEGCGTWPAWWSAGPNWPDAGEIDIIEGVNNQAHNQYTLHSGPGSSCTIDSSATEDFTSSVMGTTCLSSDGSNSGCGFSDPSTESFGPGFNAVGGGIFAHLWDSTGIKMWRFSRSAIPADITSRQPNPSSWGTPAAAWGGSSCNIKDHFYDHVLTLDTTICGDWASGAYASSGCPGTCSDMVANATNFKNANWGVKSIAIYQL